MNCPRCGEAMHEIDAGLWTCPCGASLRFEQPKPKRKRKKSDNWKRELPLPSKCMLECPERQRCDLVDTPTRCATFRAIRVKHMPTHK